MQDGRQVCPNSHIWEAVHSFQAGVHRLWTRCLLKQTRTSIAYDVHRDLEVRTYQKYKHSNSMPISQWHHLRRISHTL